MLQTLLQKRSNGYYYFRWVCPPAIRKVIGKREIIKSLRTTSKIQALARAGQLYALVDKMKCDGHRELLSEGYWSSNMGEFNLLANLKANQEIINSYLESDSARLIFRLLKAEPIAPVVSNNLDDLSESELIEFKDAQRRFTRMALERHVPKALALSMYGATQYQPLSLKEAKSTKSTIKTLLDIYKTAKTNRLGEVNDNGLRLVTIIDRSLKVESHGKAWPFVQLARVVGLEPQLYGVFLELLQDVFHYNLETLDDKFDESKIRSQISISIENAKANSPQKIVNDTKKDATSPHSAISLSVLFEEFMDHKTKEGVVLADQKEYRFYFPAVLHFVGDIPITSITKKQIKDCLTSYLKLPVRNKRPYKGKSIQELLTMEIPAADLIKPRTMGQVKKLLQGIFRYAVDKEYLTQSPAVDLNIKPDRTQRRGAYSKAQIVTLLDAAAELDGKHEWKKWAVLLAVYTGARLSEIVQLRYEDIKKDDDSGFDYLLITPKAGKIKTANAFRTIPLHSELIRMGFLNFAAENGGRIFPDNIQSATVTKWFPQFRKQALVPAATDFDEPLVFHSFRHSVVTLLRSNGVTDVQVQQLVGHEKTGAGVTDGYTHRIPVGDLKPVIEQLKY